MGVNFKKLNLFRFRKCVRAKLEAIRYYKPIQMIEIMTNIVRNRMTNRAKDRK